MVETSQRPNCACGNQVVISGYNKDGEPYYGKHCRGCYYRNKRLREEAAGYVHESCLICRTESVPCKPYPLHPGVPLDGKYTFPLCPNCYTRVEFEIVQLPLSDLPQTEKLRKKGYVVPHLTEGRLSIDPERARIYLERFQEEMGI